MAKPSESPHPERFESTHVTVIEPPRALGFLDLRELWDYRELLLSLSWRQLRVRYKQTLLGVAWALLQPAFSMVVFTVIFGRIAKLPSEGVPYPVFVYSGLLGFTLFSSATSGAVTSLVGAAPMLRKVYFPRFLMPLSAVLSAVVDFVVATTLMLALMVWYAQPFTVGLLVLPLLVAGIALAAVGVGAVLGALNVAYRDLQHALPFLLQAWMYATPVVYPARVLPPELAWIVACNPLTGLISGVRAAFLGKPFDWNEIGISLAMAVALFVFGALYFRRVEHRFADIV